MGFLFVVVVSPLTDLKARFVQRSKPVHVQAVLAEPAVVRFDKRILRRLARLDEPKLDASLFRIEKHRLAGEFGNFVANDRLWAPAALRASCVS